MKQAFIEPWVEKFSSVYADSKLADIAWFTCAPGIKVMQAVIDGIIKAGDDVVDMGCGPGSNAVFLATAGANVTGVDLSPDALGRARMLAQWAGVEVNFVNASILETGLPTASADVVNDSFTFHNVADETREQYAAEVHRVLRPGGVFLVSSFSDRMTPGSGPRRITARELLESFGGDRFECRHLEIYRNLPTEARPDQNHWFAIFRAL